MLTFKFKSILLGSACTFIFVGPALAENFNIPGGDLEDALNTYVTQTGVHLIVSEDAIKGVRSRGVKGDLSADQALSRILAGSGFTVRNESGVLAIVRGGQSSNASDVQIQPMQLAQAMPSRTAVETVTVTSSKLGGADVQNIPIAITALSQEQLTATQTAGGPDLVKQVPNLTFTKTNFTGYSIQIRGVGTQAISVTTDPAVAVALNDVPFIRNHFFEQEFYDLSQAEILRGPQGTLYGRNATAGVVNLITAKPTDQLEATLSAEIGNYHQRRLEGMVNLPIVDDRLDVRLAGEWTKRQGYSLNDLTGNRIDGRDLWSSRLTIALRPISDLSVHLVWEHFSEDDDRMRTAKQLCKTDAGPSAVDGTPIIINSGDALATASHLSQGCLATSLYSPDAFQVPNGFSLPYYGALASLGVPVRANINPYASTVQSPNPRVIESTLDPVYKAKNDTVEINVDYSVTPSLTLSAQTSFSQDSLWSTEDYNRFNTAPGVFIPGGNRGANGGTAYPVISSDGTFCDPQLGCSNRLVAEDLSNEHAWQFGEEVRLASKLDGPFNFSAGANYLHYETEENYYVFINSLTLYGANYGDSSLGPWVPGQSDNHECLPSGHAYGIPGLGSSTQGCMYIDPNPITKLNNAGHNYFLSQNPYILNSYAAFGETYYDVSSTLKLTAGLRWTEDQKSFPLMPSWLVVQDSWGYPVVGVVDQQWDQFTGRMALNWTPKLSFTDQTLAYGSYSHGYKAGGANPPGAVLLVFSDVSGDIGNPVHPMTFKPEFIDAFELGSKNTLADGTLTFNASAFYYNYENYQISEIVDRTSINLNFDAHIYGAEVEASWEPIPRLRFNFGGGYEHSSLATGSKAVDIIDRTAGNPGWLVYKPFVTQASNCILPSYVVAKMLSGTVPGNFSQACGDAYTNNHDPVTFAPYSADPIPGYSGFDPSTAPNGGQGFDKDLSGNSLPNAPPFTISAGAQYSIPLSPDWAGTMRVDYYWQDYSWARVFNDNPYDRLRGYTNVNLNLIFTNQNGWQMMLYDKNIFNTTAITGAFLNSDDSGLTTNIFLTDPRLIGIRVTKNW